MQDFFVLFLTAIFLVSCASPVTTISPTTTNIPPTQTPSPTDTPVPATATAPAVDISVEDIYKIGPVFPIDTTTESGFVVSGGFAVGRSVGDYKIEMPQRLGGSILAETVARYLYNHGSDPQKGDPSAMDVQSTIAQLAASQESGDFFQATADTSLFDIDKQAEGYAKRKVVFFPGDKVIPSDAMAVHRIILVFEEGHIITELGVFRADPEKPGMVLGGQVGQTYAAILDGEILWIMYGPSYLFTREKADNYAAKTAASMLHWISFF